MFVIYIFFFLFSITSYANGHGFKLRYGNTCNEVPFKHDIYFLSPPEQMNFQCYEKDEAPVDVNEVFEGQHCADKNGNSIFRRLSLVFL